MTHTADEYPELGHFFACEFHADWDDDYPPGADWSDVVEDYLDRMQDASYPHLSELVGELERLLAASGTDEELEHTVYQFGSYYPFDLEEVGGIRSRIQAYLDTHPDDGEPPEPGPTGT